MRYNFGLAGMAGSFKGVFVHGALQALIEGGVNIDIYGACSSSCVPILYACCGKLDHLGVDYWEDCVKWRRTENKNMSQVMKASIARIHHDLEADLLSDRSKPLLVCTSHLECDALQDDIQGDRACSLGRKLLLNAKANQDSWAKKNLCLHCYETDNNAMHKLTKSNLDEVIYASTRMLHAWPEPAWINKEVYVDGCYTCYCPIDPLFEKGCDRVIAILTEAYDVKANFFNTGDLVQTKYLDNTVVIKPCVNLEYLGVNFTDATIEGINLGFQHGYEQAQLMLQQL